MKRILLFVLVLTAGEGRAQNWNPLPQVGVKRYFTNEDGYLRGMRVDSATTSVAGDSVWHTFKTPRATKVGFLIPVDASGPSWLGLSPRRQVNGTWLFTNFFGDTVILKPLASPGTSWRFYDDSSSVWFTATVSAVDTQTVQNVLDSIKIITVTTANSSGLLPSHPLNGWTIILAKNSGFLRVPDLYAWPYRRPNQPYGNLDYNTSIITRRNVHSFAFDSTNLDALVFTLCHYQQPSLDMLYDWHQADRYLYHAIKHPINGGLGPYIEDYLLDSVLSRSGQAVGHLLASDSSRWRTTISTAGTTNQNTHGVRVRYCDTSVVTTNIFPEEAPAGSIIYYQPNDSSLGKRSIRWDVIPDVYEVQQDSSLHHFLGQVTVLLPKQTYKSGLGLTYSFANEPNGVREFWMIGWTAGTRQYGMQTPPPLGIPVYPQSADFVYSFSPNPASDMLSITGRAPFASLRIYGVDGRVYLYEGNTSSGLTTVDIRRIPAGTYFLGIMSPNGSRHTEKIIIAR